MDITYYNRITYINIYYVHTMLKSNPSGIIML